MTTLSIVCQKDFTMRTSGIARDRVKVRCGAISLIQLGVWAIFIAALQHRDCGKKGNLSTIVVRASRRIYGQDMTTLCNDVLFGTCDTLPESIQIAM
jgi:hypothetical protein